MSGLRGFRVRAARAGVAGVTGWRAAALPAVSGGFRQPRAEELVYVRPGGGTCVRVRRLETGLVSPGAAAARRPASSSRGLAAALTPVSAALPLGNAVGTRVHRICSVVRLLPSSGSFSSNQGSTLTTDCPANIK